MQFFRQWLSHSVILTSATNRKVGIVIYKVRKLRDIILSNNSHPLFTQIVSCDSRQHRASRYPSLPLVRVHTFQFNVLQLMLPFYSSSVP